MLLRRKILQGALATSVLAVIMVLLSYFDFVEIRGEVVSLELSDSIRSKTLQLRRHEKNYFLYRTQIEYEGVIRYLGELDKLLAAGGTSNLAELKSKVSNYRARFTRVVSGADAIRDAIDEASARASGRTAALAAYVKSTLLDNPRAAAEMLRVELALGWEHPIIRLCGSLNGDIAALRNTGEDMLAISKRIDAEARDKIDSTISRSQMAVFVFLPVFLSMVVLVSLYMGQSILSRLSALTEEIDKTKRGLHIKSLYAPGGEGMDEIDAILLKFRHLEDELAEREFELIQQKKLSAIGTLASGVAHELNNPLNNIYTTAQRMKKLSGPEFPPQVQKGLDDIFTQTMRVKKIVADLLEFARTREPVRQDVKIYDVIGRALDFVGNAIDLKDIRLDSSLRGESPVVSADMTQMEQVFINLITNAVEAMGGAGTLSMNASASDGMAHVEIADTGKGISQSGLEKIFEPFYTTKEKGTGLGLAVVHGIIRKHGGEIRADSIEGEGTVFYIDLPLVVKEAA